MPWTQRIYISEKRSVKVKAETIVGLCIEKHTIPTITDVPLYFVADSCIMSSTDVEIKDYKIQAQLLIDAIE